MAIRDHLLCKIVENCRTTVAMLVLLLAFALGCESADNKDADDEGSNGENGDTTDDGDDSSASTANDDDNGATCGNGVVESDEQCDDGNVDDCEGDCLADCSGSVEIFGCGDGVTCGNEVCDDGDTSDAGYCSGDCTANLICPEGILDDNYTIETEEELAIISECTEITGDLRIEYSTLTSLDGLEQLVSVSGDFYIFDNRNLTSISALQSLTAVGGNFAIGSSISVNPNLADIDGLSNLRSVGGILSVGNCGELTSLSPLSSVTSLGGVDIQENAKLAELGGAFDLVETMSMGVSIYLNRALLHIEGFNNLTEIGGILQIDGNSELLDIKGFPKLSHVCTQTEGNEENEFMSSLHGCLTIGGSFVLTDISGLSNLKSVGGDMELSDTPDVNTLKSLEQVDGDFDIYGCNGLVTLSGLNSLTEVGGDFYVDSNEDLVTIEGLNSLTSVNGILKVWHNDFLTTVSGFEALQTIGGSLGVSSNESLIDLNGFYSIESVGDAFEIILNHKLPTCEAEGLRDAIGVSNIGGEVKISSTDDTGVCED